MEIAGADAGQKAPRRQQAKAFRRLFGTGCNPNRKLQ
jgi:hypothetical protein